MRIFTLMLEEDGAGEPRRIEFSGFDPSDAFTLLKTEKSARKASLWERDTRLGTIERAESGYWTISA